MVIPGEIALDSNIAIAILNQDEVLISRLQSVEVFYLPITVCGELLYGAKNSAKAKENELNCWALIDRCHIIGTNLLIADEYATLRQELQKKGKPIPENDIWIGASCRANRLALATRDKHFQHITNLEVIKL